MCTESLKKRAEKASRALCSLVLALACVMLCVPIAAQAAPSDDKQAEADAARAKLDDMQSQLNEASDQYYTALEEHDAAVAKMAEEQAVIDELAVKIDESKSDLAARAVSMYRGGQVSMMDVLLGSASFSEFATTWDFMVSWNEDTSALIETDKSLKAQSEAAFAEYEQQEQIAQDKLDEAESVKAEAEALVEQYQAEVDSLDAEVAELLAAEEAAREAAAQAAYTGTDEVQQPSSSVVYNEGGSSDSSGSSSGDDSSGSSGDDSSSSYDVPSGGYSSVVDAAYSRLGCPYVWGATGPNTFDCSGLTQWCYAQAGISIPRTSSAQRAAGTVISLSQAQPGDVLWKSGHVGIYIGGGAFIHAPQSGDVVKISYYMSMWTCALRF